MTTPAPNDRTLRRDSGRTTRRLTLAAAATAVLLAACAANQVSSGAIPSGAPVPGFWLGLWHGFIAPITFVVSLFSDHVRIYAFPNAGRWYDFGFMLGISGFSGGIFAGSRNRPARARQQP